MTRFLLLFLALGSMAYQLEVQAADSTKKVRVYPGAICSGEGDISNLELLQTKPPSKVGFDIGSMVALRTKEKPTPRIFRLQALSKDKKTKEAIALFVKVSTEKIIGITFKGNTKRTLKGKPVFVITLIAGNRNEYGQTDPNSIEQAALLCPTRMTDSPEEIGF